MASFVRLTSRCMGTLAHVPHRAGASATLPAMVDVTGKKATKREALAEARVHLTPSAYSALIAGGPDVAAAVFSTATVAGINAAKATSTLIPMCHTLALEACDVRLSVEPQQAVGAEGPAGVVVVTCRAATTHKSGVEMEALTGRVIDPNTTNPNLSMIIP